MPTLKRVPIKSDPADILSAPAAGQLAAGSAEATPAPTEVKPASTADQSDVFVNVFLFSFPFMLA